MGKVRLADIAEQVGTSTVTVHNALSGTKGVSSELRAKILETAEKMGYRRPSSGQKQENGQEEAWKIGVLIAENYLAHYSTYYWKLYQELSLYATEKRCYTTIEVLKKEMEKRTLELPMIVRNNSIDGLIIIGEIDKRYVRELYKNAGIPIVFVDFYDNDIVGDAVIADNFYGMYQMTELLFAQGFREIGFVGSIYATSSIMDRYCGYRKAMLEHRREVLSEWIIEDRDELGQVGFDLPKRLPEAFVCNCDLIAAILIKKLKEKGYRVPEDVSVVGFDNYYLYPGYGEEKITTYEVNTRAMAKVAVDKMLNRLKNPRKTGTLEIISGQVVLKKSVKLK